MNKIITISREFGSGGRSIGKEAAKRLEIPYYDKELIKQVAEKQVLRLNILKNRGNMHLGKPDFPMCLHLPEDRIP